MCGICTDSLIAHWLPFIPYVGGVFLLHTLTVGNFIAFVAAEAGQRPVYPWKYFLGFLGLLIASVIILMASLLLPLLIILCFWVGRLLRNLRVEEAGTDSLLRREAIVILVTVGLIVPLAYLFPIQFYETYYQKSW